MQAYLRIAPRAFSGRDWRERFSFPLGRLPTCIAVVNPLGIGRIVIPLQPFHLPLAQPKQHSRLSYAQTPFHRALNYFQPLQLLLAQCHPPLNRLG